MNRKQKVAVVAGVVVAGLAAAWVALYRPHAPGARVDDRGTEASAGSGSRLQVRVEGLQERVGLMRAVVVEEDALEPLRREDLLSRGQVVFRGLKPSATYSLWVHGGGEGWYVYERGLVPGRDEMVVTARQGSCIRGRLVLPDAEEIEWGTVWAEWAERPHDPFVALGIVDEDGRFELSGLPQGSWLVRASAGARLDTATEAWFAGKDMFTAGSEDVTLQVLRREGPVFDLGPVTIEVR